MYVIYDTAARSRHTHQDRPDAATAVLAWCRAIIEATEYANAPVFDEIPRIRVHPQTKQTGAVNDLVYDNRCRRYLVYDTAAYSRHGPRIG